MAVEISASIVNFFGSLGGNAIFAITAEVDHLSYQWKRSTDDGETWSNISGGTSTTLSIPIQASVNGNLYRCIAKDYMGHIATSQAGRMSVTSALSTLSEFEPEFTVINEPDDYYGRPGDIATFIVEAEGANLSYQWLCRAPGADNFEYLASSDATTNTLRVEMTAASNGAEYRCFITDANGDMGSTRVATIKLDILDWEMEYNTSGIRTKRVSDEMTYSYMPKQHMPCKILPQHMIPGVLGFQGFFLRSGDSFHNASPFKPCKLPKKQGIQYYMLLPSLRVPWLEKTQLKGNLDLYQILPRY